MERRIVGFDRKIELSWMDATADWAAQGLSPAQVRRELSLLLAGCLSGEGSNRAKGKTITVLSHIWLRVPAHLSSFKNDGLSLIPNLSSRERLPLHWGMSLATYPFFRDTARICGRLINLQGSVTVSQVVRRLKELWGDRSTVVRAAQRVVRSMALWSALQEAGKKGTYSPTPRQDLQHGDPRGPWLIEATLAGNGSRPFQSIVNSPELFPFSLQLSPQEIESNSRLELSRQGVCEDVVVWRGSGSEKKASKSSQPSLWG